MLNKIDLVNEEEAKSVEQEVIDALEVKPERVFRISALNKSNINELIFAVQDLVDEIKQRELDALNTKADVARESEEFVWAEPTVKHAPPDVVDEDYEPEDDGPEFIYRN